LNQATHPYQSTVFETAENSACNKTQSYKTTVEQINFNKNMIYL